MSQNQTEIKNKKLVHCHLFEYILAQCKHIQYELSNKLAFISPGINLYLNTVFSKASLIPEINLKKISYVIGKNTNEAVRSGFYWGYAGLIDNMIKLIKRQTKSDFKVILTGGLADLYKNSINTKCKIDKDLTIKGIIKITKNLI